MYDNPGKTCSVIQKIVDFTFAPCVRQCLQTALGSFAAFQELDQQNCRNYEAKNPGKTIPPISLHCRSFQDLDFQACVKALCYLPRVTEQIASYYHTDPSYATSKEGQSHLHNLLKFRNEYLGHFSSDSLSQEKSWLKIDRQGAFHIGVILEKMFPNVMVSPGKTYLEQFNELSIELEKEYASERYLYSKSFPDGSVTPQEFENACLALGIPCEVRDGQWTFISIDPQKDIRSICTFTQLARDGRSKDAQIQNLQDARVQDLKDVQIHTVQSPTAEVLSDTTVSQPKPRAYPPKSVNLFLVFGMAVIAILLIAGILLISPEKNNSPEMEKLPQTTEQADSSFESGGQSTGNPISGEDTSVPETTAAPETTVIPGENEIPEEFRQNVLAFKSSDPGFQRVSTIRVAVGDTVTPQSAMIWTDVMLFSEDTSIARVSNGVMVEGVSKGTTYIAVTSSSLCSVYKVNVY